MTDQLDPGFNKRIEAYMAHTNTKLDEISLLATSVGVLRSDVTHQAEHILRLERELAEQRVLTERRGEKLETAITSTANAHRAGDYELQSQLTSAISDLNENLTTVIKKLDEQVSQVKTDYTSDKQYIKGIVAGASAIGFILQAGVLYYVSEVSHRINDTRNMVVADSERINQLEEDMAVVKATGRVSMPRSRDR